MEKIVDDRLVAKFGMLVDQRLDLVAEFIVGIAVAKEFLDFGGCYHALGCIVEIDIDKHDHASRKFHLLFAVRDKEFFPDKTPVKECAGVVDLRHLKIGKLADFSKGVFGSGDGTVLRIFVDEHFKFVARLKGHSDITGRQKDFVSVAVSKIRPEIYVAGHLQ